jgi:hypothetical protein
VAAVPIASQTRILKKLLISYVLAVIYCDNGKERSGISDEERVFY